MATVINFQVTEESSNPPGGGSPVLAARRINIMTGRALNILIGQVLLALHCTAGSRNNSVPLMPSPTQLQLHNNVMIVIVILIVTCSLTYKRILDLLTNTHKHNSVVRSLNNM